MQTIKLYEATKQFKISKKLAMFFLEKKNVPVKSHSSIISMDQLELLREFSSNMEKFSDIKEEFDSINKAKKAKGKPIKEIGDYEISEAKLMVVGSGGVGKTSIINRLINDKEFPNDVTTMGLETKKWKIKTQDNQDFILNVWDFGGQEIYHSTCRFFFPGQSLFLLVCNTRMDENLNSLYYWINTIKLYSNGSPVIIVLNKIDVRMKVIDEYFLWEQFDNIVAFHEVSAKTGSGISNLVESIKTEAIQLPPINEKLPKTWKEIREKIENLSKDYVNYQEYSEICSGFGVDERGASIISQYLHDIGAIFHFQDNDSLKKIIILKTGWFTNALYKIFDNRKIYNNHGKVHSRDLDAILKGYPKEFYNFVIELLKKFEMCFNIENTQSYIFTNLIDRESSELEWDYKNNLKFEYQYGFLPKEIIGRFIARIYKLIKDNIYWRYGTVIKVRNAEALIIFNSSERIISVRLKGKSKKALLKKIRKEFDEIHKTYAYLDIREKIPCICDECKDSKTYRYYDLDIIKRLRTKHKKTVECNVSFKNVNIDTLMSFYNVSVLVIDDEHQALQSMQKFLQTHNYEVLTASDGVEGIEIFRKYKPDLVITDTLMPKMGGFEVASRLKEIDKNIPIIVLSVSVGKEVSESFSDIGVSHLITKPFEIDELINKVEMLLAETMDSPEISIDEDEEKIRQYISEGEYLKGRELLSELIESDRDGKQRLLEEFGFLYDFENTLVEDKKNWRKKEGQIVWRKQLWQIFAAQNNFELKKIEEKDNKKVPVNTGGDSKRKPNKEDKETSKIIDDEKGKTPEEKGEALEQEVLELFRYFLSECEKHEGFKITKIRQQKRGRQSGHDLKSVYEIKREEIRTLIECKNYKDVIRSKDIADKLLSAEAYHKEIKEIDHWILISPRVNVSNELEELLELWEKSGKYPFNVQVWTPDTRVKDFFGLVPEIYDNYFKPGKGEEHPKDWDKIKKKKVIEFWKKKLEPPLRLPTGWESYILEPKKLILHGDPKNIETLYHHHVTMRCKDETGELFKQTLEEKVFEWLEKPINDSSSLILLGEFGDGKSVFTYIFNRKLNERFRLSPKTGWISIRFSLKLFGSEYVDNTRDFVENRLKEFGADINGWSDLKQSNYNLLVILDGFDEISKKLDPESILGNINNLIKCYRNEFNGMKLLITSRKHFFENQRNKEKLIKRIGNPQILQVAPVDRQTTEEHIEEYAKQINEEEKFNKLKTFHDPIGLASKPLFLEMVKFSLSELPNKDLNELILYETYSQKALERKDEFLEDVKLETTPEDTIENMKKILETVAVELHKSKEEFVYLSEIKGEENIKKQLWHMTVYDDGSEEKTKNDEEARVAVRSLLKRIGDNDNNDDNKQWPIDFCHRSMREYFVARAVCNMVKNDIENAEEFLKNHSLSFEVIFFSGEVMKNSGLDYEENSVKLIDTTKNLKGSRKLGTGFLGGNAVNLLYRYKGSLPGKDWSSLILDGADLAEADLSGKDFSGTSLQHAILDNVDFTEANFSNCNLTGVRFEETSYVQSVATAQSGKIYVSYDDGTIREWIRRGKRKPYSKNLDFPQKMKNIRLIARPENALTLLHEQRLLFFDIEDNSMQKKSVIEVKTNRKLLKSNRDTILMVEERKGGNKLLLIDLEDQAVLRSAIIPPFSICDNLSARAFVIYHEDIGLRVIDVETKEQKKLTIKNTENISCLTARQLHNSADQFLLAIGQKNGVIQLYKIDLANWTETLFLQHKAHEKTVKDIAFIDDGHIISGGYDKKLLLLSFNRKGDIKGEPQELRISIECRGMKIDGVIRDEEQKKLLEFKAKSGPVKK